MWRGVAPLLAAISPSCAPICAAMDRAAVRPRRRSCAVLEARDGARHGGRHAAARPFRASPSPAMTAAVASPIAWRSIIRIASRGWRCSTCCRSRRVGARRRPPGARLLAVVAAGAARTAARAHPRSHGRGDHRQRAAGMGLGRRRVSGRGSSQPTSRRCADTDHAHAICEEYRAAAGIDREHDRQDRTDGRRIACPVLALWSAPALLAPGTTRMAGRWRYGGNGRTTSVARPSTAAISSRKSCRSRPPTRSAGSFGEP